MALLRVAVGDSAVFVSAAGTVGDAAAEVGRKCGVADASLTLDGVALDPETPARTLGRAELQLQLPQAAARPEPLRRGYALGCAALLTTGCLAAALLTRRRPADPLRTATPAAAAAAVATTASAVIPPPAPTDGRCPLPTPRRTGAGTEGCLGRYGNGSDAAALLLPHPSVALCCGAAALNATRGTPDVAWPNGGPGPPGCVGRNGEPLGAGVQGVFTGEGAPDWWRECLHRDAPPLPPLRTPAALASLAAKRPCAEIRGAADCSAPLRAAAVVAALARADRSRPEIVVVHAADRPLKDMPQYAKLAGAATALWTLAHGYGHVWYSLDGACKAPRVPPSGVVPRHLDCWQGGFYILPSWVKAFAAKHAVETYRAAQWLLLLDTDATPRHLGWSARDVLAAAAAQQLDSGCGGGKGCSADQPVARRSELPATIAAVAAREPIAGERSNTGVLLLRVQDPGPALVNDWWSSRDDDCRYSCSDRGWCLPMGRVAHGGDQRPWSYGLWSRHGAAGRVAEVPMLLMNSPAGLFVSHHFARKGTTTDAFFTEVLLRHTGSIWSLLGCGGGGGCADPRVIAQSAEAAAGCAKLVDAWVEAAVAAVPVRSIAKEWQAAPSRIDSGCLQRLSQRLAYVALPRGQRKLLRNSAMARGPIRGRRPGAGPRR